MVPARCAVSLVCLLGLTVGCVTTHYGEGVKSPGQDFTVSCSDNYEIDHGQFSGVVCTFENTTKEWQTFELREVKALMPGGAVAHVATPSEINDFLAAYRFEQEKNGRNTDVLLAGLVLGGVGAMIAGGDSPVGTAGAVTAVGAGAYSGARDFTKDHRQTQYGKVRQGAAEAEGPGYGPEHMLGGAFRVPSELFVRKHLLAEYKGSEAKIESLELCFAKPRAECMQVPLYWGTKGAR